MSNYASKALAAASALLLGVPTAVLSHTNSIGYVGDGNGGVTFWYGNWHPGTTFTEGSMTLQGVNGNSFAPTTVNWTLIQNTMPTGLIPGTNYFTSDGVNLVPYNTNIQTSYTWQGVSFTGLSAGDYQFTYNPIAQPTANWAPMDSLINSSTVTITAAALSGDADGDGINDSTGQTVTPPAPTPPPAPTQVSTASGSDIVTTSTTTGTRTVTGSPHRHIMGTDADGNQTETHYTDSSVRTIPTTTVTTTTTPVTVTTWSDGSTTTTNGTPTSTSVTTDDNTGTIVVTQTNVIDWVKTRTYDVQRTAYAPSGAAPTVTETHRFNATENSESQKVNHHTTTGVTTPTVRTVTTTPVYTKVYTNGAATEVTNDPSVITYDTSTSYAEYYASQDYFGRIDQYNTLDTINSNINGLLDHEPSKTEEKFRVFGNSRYVWSSADGYNADSRIFGGGFEYDIKPTWTVGAQYNNVNINLDGTDSSSTQKKNHIGVFNALYSKWTTLNTNFGYAMNTYTSKRTVEGVFFNESNPKGNEWWLHNRLYVHPTTGVSPYIGYTVGQFNRDGYTETGSIQSARTVDAVRDFQNTGEVGLKLEHKFGKFGVSIDGSYNTDAVASASASINYNEMIFIEGNYDTNGTVTDTSGTVKLKFRF